MLAGKIACVVLQSFARVLTWTIHGDVPALGIVLLVVWKRAEAHRALLGSLLGEDTLAPPFERAIFLLDARHVLVTVVVLVVLWQVAVVPGLVHVVPVRVVPVVLAVAGRPHVLLADVQDVLNQERGGETPGPRRRVAVLVILAGVQIQLIQHLGLR